jgi:spore coat protein U-like protein
VRGEAPVRSARFLLVATVAVAVLIGARPSARDGQFPRGLMSTAPTAVVGCTIETRPLSFGTYDQSAETDVDATAQVIYTCTNDLLSGPGVRGVTIRIEMTQGFGNSFDPRRMTGPGFETLDYNIYLDARYRTIWGTGVGRTQVYRDVHPPNQTPVVVTVYGRIFARQDVSAGAYVDSIRVGIVF